LYFNLSWSEFELTMAKQHSPFAVVVGATLERGIGFKGTLPWPQLPGDMAWFREKTMSTVAPNKTNALIMGRKTWESIPLKFRPLPKRINIILSKTAEAKDLEGYKEGLVFVCRSLDDALTLCEDKLEDQVEKAIVIGGASLYNESFKHPSCKWIYYTEIHKKFDCDTFIDIVPYTFLQTNSTDPSVRTEKDIEYCFITYEREEEMN
jgi:dihydrofolate reductase/thymidylate synthase